MQTENLIKKAPVLYGRKALNKTDIKKRRPRQTFEKSNISKIIHCMFKIN